MTTDRHDTIAVDDNGYRIYVRRATT